MNRENTNSILSCLLHIPIALIQSIHTLPLGAKYWIDEFVLDDDPLLPEKERNTTNLLA
jgi:hypothetical protein